MSILDSDVLFAEVVQRLRLAAQDDRTFDAAQMKLINLPEIIATAGADWAMLKDRIRAGSVNFLRGCLADEDIVIPAGDGFLILFADGDPQTLRERAEELRLLLLEFYLGQEGLKALRIAAQPRQIHSCELRTMMAPPPPPSLDIVSQDWTFVPLWTPRAGVFASYYCTPTHVTPHGVAYGYDAHFAETGRNEHSDYCAFDLELLDVVREAFESQAGKPVQPALAASVHVTTLQNSRARTAFLEKLARMPEAHRSHLIVRIAEIEAGVPLINLTDWAWLLRSRASRVLLEFHGSEPAPHGLAQVGVWGAGYQMQASRSPAKREIQLQRWARDLSLQRIQFVVGNLPDAHWVKAAAAACAQFVACPNLWPPHQSIMGVVRAAAPYAGRQR